MHEELDCEIRYTTEADEAPIAEWLSDPNVLKWFPFGEGEIGLVSKNWSSYSRFSSSLTLVYEGKACGVATIFFMPYIRLSHQATLLIAVDPKEQHKGFGGILIRNIVHLAKNYFNLELLGIEIYHGCPITSLLEKNKFKLIYAQDNYFREGDQFIAREYWEVQLR